MTEEKKFEPTPPPYNRLYDESKKNQNPRVAKLRMVDQRKDEIEWRKRLEAQHLTESSSHCSWGCPSQKRVKSPPLRIPVEKRPMSQRLPSYNTIKKINNNIQKPNVMTVSPGVKKFALPPIDYSNLNSVNEKPRSKFLFFYDMLLGL